MPRSVLLSSLMAILLGGCFQNTQPMSDTGSTSEGTGSESTDGTDSNGSTSGDSEGSTGGMPDVPASCSPGAGDCSEDEYCIDGACVDTLPPGMVAVSSGSFWMGCDEDLHDDCELDELPFHPVSLSAFAIDATEVTVAEYAECVDDGACTIPDLPDTDTPCNWAVGNQDHPANCATWEQASNYCAWRGQQLPTEAQWAKAARGTEGARWPWGTEPLPDCTLAIMVFNDGMPDLEDWGCGVGTTWPVGSVPAGASPYGALDMTGNVWEWTADWYAEDAYGSHGPVDPVGPGTGTHRVIRGASFKNGSEATLRPANRGIAKPDQSSDHFGFRCALPAG